MIEVNRDYISTKNTYKGQNRPKYIVVHETDNYRNGAGALVHAQAQAAGHLDTSVHYYCGSDGIYQAAEHADGTFSIGNEYGNQHSVTDATNRNSINIEICVNQDGDYGTARGNAVELVRHLITITGVPAERVIRHFDAKGKYCPRKMMDNGNLWVDFKEKIGHKVETEQTEPMEVEYWYRVGTGWEHGLCLEQTGAYLVKENAITACKRGYHVYDINGNDIYSVSGSEKKTDISGDPVIWNIQKWCNLYAKTGLTVDGIYGSKSKNALCRSLQHYHNKAFGAGLDEDGIFGSKTKAACKIISGKSELVYIGQALLHCLGYDMSHSIRGDVLDGIYGAGTKNMVARFQKDKQIKQDGKCGSETFYYMFI